MLAICKRWNQKKKKRIVWWLSERKVNWSNFLLLGEHTVFQATCVMVEQTGAL